MRAAFVLAAVAASIAACDRAEPDPAASPGASGQEDTPAATGAPAPIASPNAAGRVAVGDAAPAFTLKDQNGREHTLAALVAKGKVALVFYRSAVW